MDEEFIYPVIKGTNLLQQTIAVCEMLAIYQKTPFRKDIISKLLEEHYKRGKVLSVELLAKASEYLGLNCQLGKVNTKYISSIEAPALCLYRDTPVIIYNVSSDQVIIGDPLKGLQHISLTEFISVVGESLKFALPRRTGTTPYSRFGWNWFTPLIIKYKKSLILVFIASLLAQLLVWPFL